MYSYSFNNIIYIVCEYRQYSTESQHSVNYIHSSNKIETEITKPNNVGEKLIEVEKAETGSVSCIRKYQFLELRYF